MNNNDLYTTTDDAFIAEMKEISSSVRAPESVLRSVLETSGKSRANEQRWQEYVSVARLTSWRVAVPAMLALVLIFAGVLRENTFSNPVYPATPVGTGSGVALNQDASGGDQDIQGSNADDDSDAALDQDLSQIDSQLSGLDSDTSNADSALMDDGGQTS